MAGIQGVGIELLNRIVETKSVEAPNFVTVRYIRKAIRRKREKYYSLHQIFMEYISQWYRNGGVQVRSYKIPQSQNYNCCPPIFNLNE